MFIGKVLPASDCWSAMVVRSTRTPFMEMNARMEVVMTPAHTMKHSAQTIEPLLPALAHGEHILPHPPKHLCIFVDGDLGKALLFFFPIQNIILSQKMKE